MNFSAKTEYGVRVMVELGRQYGGSPTSLKAISEAEGLPLSYLEHVVADLKRAGLVEATRGARGGYRLQHPPAKIGMDEVVTALEGTLAPMECFVTLPTSRVSCSHEGDLGHGCATKLLWTRVQGSVVRALKGTTLAELVEFSDSHAPVAAA